MGVLLQVHGVCIHPFRHNGFNRHLGHPINSPRLFLNGRSPSRVKRPTITGGLFFKKDESFPENLPFKTGGFSETLSFLHPKGGLSKNPSGGTHFLVLLLLLSFKQSPKGGLPAANLPAAPSRDGRLQFSFRGGSVGQHFITCVFSEKGTNKFLAAHIG